MAGALGALRSERVRLLTPAAGGKRIQDRRRVRLFWRDVLTCRPLSVQMLTERDSFRACQPGTLLITSFCDA
jgi:hypothetical protein